MDRPTMTAAEVRELPALIGVKEVCRLTGWNQNNVTTKAKRGALPWPCRKLSYRWLFPTDKVLEALGIDYYGGGND